MKKNSMEKGPRKCNELVVNCQNTKRKDYELCDVLVGSVFSTNDCNSCWGKPKPKPSRAKLIQLAKATKPSVADFSLRMQMTTLQVGPLFDTLV